MNIDSETIDKIAEMWESGASRAEVCARFGISPHALTRLRRIAYDSGDQRFAPRRMVMSGSDSGVTFVPVSQTAFDAEAARAALRDALGEKSVYETLFKAFTKIADIDTNARSNDEAMMREALRDLRVPETLFPALVNVARFLRASRGAGRQNDLAARLRLFDRAYKIVENQLGRAPRRREIADLLGKSINWVDQMAALWRIVVSPDKGTAAKPEPAAGPQHVSEPMARIVQRLRDRRRGRRPKKSA